MFVKVAHKARSCENPVQKNKKLFVSVTVGLDGLSTLAEPFCGWMSNRVKVWPGTRDQASQSFLEGTALIHQFRSDLKIDTTERLASIGTAT